ncbi:hypothetical protein [Kribbella sp. NPDC006257]|uniref:hypothetical protein n=1 Tax=Kribbella sp. NPDC006257 TaxID=3156738 RepID=UPI0033B453D7
MLTVVFAVYVFALLAALLTVGSLSDRVGRRRIGSCRARLRCGIPLRRQRTR